MGISIPAPEEGSAWRTILRVALLFLAEAALIALIKDAPLIVLIATVLCAIAALVLLESEGWLGTKHSRAFTGAVAVVSLIYIAFVGYAIGHAIQREATNKELIKRYVSTTALFEEGQSLNGLPPNSTDPKFLGAVDEFVQHWISWNEKTRNWLTENIGDAAREQFLDISSLPTYCWGPPNQGCNQKVSYTYNQIINAKKNLAVIIQNRDVRY